MSITVEQNVWINRPVSDVFSFVTNPDNFTEYMPGVSNARFTKGTEGVGTQITFDYKMMGSTFEIIAEWQEFKPNEKLIGKNVKGHPSEFEMLFREEKGGTRINRVVNVPVNNLMGKLTKPFVRRHTTRTLEMEFATLKDMLEMGQD